jgi:hypothetical protein
VKKINPQVGDRPRGAPPYGFTVDKERGGTLIEDPREQWVIKQILALNARGFSLGRISRAINQFATNRAGNDFTKETVRRILVHSGIEGQHEWTKERAKRTAAKRAAAEAAAAPPAPVEKPVAEETDDEAIDEEVSPLTHAVEEESPHPITCDLDEDCAHDEVAAMIEEDESAIDAQRLEEDERAAVAAASNGDCPKCFRRAHDGECVTKLVPLPRRKVVREPRKETKASAAEVQAAIIDLRGRFES